MKKLFTIVAGALLMASFSTYAQTPKRSNVDYVSVGPVAGFGHSWLTGVDDQDFKAAFHLGIGMIYSKREHFGWGTDLVVSHEGYKMEDNASNTELVVNPVYLRLTPKFYYFFGKYGDKVRPKLYAGPSLAYKMDEHINWNDEALSDDEVNTLFGGEIFNDLDVGLTAGFGVNIELKKGIWLNLDGSYYHGLLDVTDEGNANRNLKLNVGVLIGL